MKYFAEIIRRNMKRIGNLRECHRLGKVLIDIFFNGIHQLLCHWFFVRFSWLFKDRLQNGKIKVFSVDMALVCTESGNIFCNAVKTHNITVDPLSRKKAGKQKLKTRLSF